MFGLLLLTGCGAGTVVVEGQLMVNGQPYRAKDKERVMIVYLPDLETRSPNDPTHPATMDREGNFKVLGAEKKGIAPGKYKITITAFEPGSDEGDRFLGAYAPAKTTLTHDVSSSNRTIKLEVKTP